MTMRGSWMFEWSVQAYRLLLHVYPTDFKRECGADMLQAFRATPWTPRLRQEWGARWEQLNKLGRNTEVVAKQLTPMGSRAVSL